jgi:hypothetical protein
MDLHSLLLLSCWFHESTPPRGLVLSAEHRKHPASSPAVE